MMLDLDAADVETARPAARSPDTKAAVAYLIASGATAISIIENETGCAYRVGIKLDPSAASVHWIAEIDAKPVVRLARRIAGKTPDIVAEEAALRQVSVEKRATLTMHNTAILRAADAAKRRLDHTSRR